MGLKSPAAEGAMSREVVADSISNMALQRAFAALILDHYVLIGDETALPAIEPPE